MGYGRLVFLFLIVICVSCSAASSTQSSQLTSQLTTIDVRRVLERNPEINQLKNQEKTTVEQIQLLDEKGQKIEIEMRDELAKITDRQSLAWKNKESGYRRELESVIQKIEKLRLSFFQKNSTAYDKAYNEMMTVALKVAKRRGASIVLPKMELPDPHLVSDGIGDPANQFSSYVSNLRLRPVVTSIASIDITGDVLRELNWKK